MAGTGTVDMKLNRLRGTTQSLSGCAGLLHVDFFYHQQDSGCSKLIQFNMKHMIMSFIIEQCLVSAPVNDQATRRVADPAGRTRARSLPHMIRTETSTRAWQQPEAWKIKGNKSG